MIIDQLMVSLCFEVIVSVLLSNGLIKVFNLGFSKVLVWLIKVNEEKELITLINQSTKGLELGLI